MDEVAVFYRHAMHRHIAGKIDDMHKGMRGCDRSGQKLKASSDHRNVTNAAIGHDTVAAERFVHVRLYLAPEGAIARGIVKILDHHPARIGLRGHVIEIILSLLHVTLTAKRGWVLGAHGHGLSEADLRREIGKRAL